MEKKNYLQPQLRVVRIATVSMINASTTQVSSVNTSTDIGLHYEGGGSGQARSRQHSVWGDEEDYNE